jgi:DNA-binding transcriptional MerR regulator
VDAERLLGIGSFAMLTGLSIPALRHYAEVGVLTPARIDPQTGYRYFGEDQAPTGRLVRALRGVDLPLDDVAEIVRGGDARAILERHRERLAERAEQVSRQLAAVDDFIEKGVAVPTIQGSRIVLINIPVHDLAEARGFYEAMLDVELVEERHDDGTLHLNATFGEWDTPSWFLLSLWQDPAHAGAGDIGFLVEDLDAAYERALASGAASVHAPRDVEGMPRLAQVRDPSGNHVGLYQG